MDAIAQAVNTVARFLAHAEIESAAGVTAFYDSQPQPPSGHDIIALCGSAILFLADEVLSLLSSPAYCRERNRQIILVLTGGVGHSTRYLYDAIRRHPKYHVLANEISGKPEARIFEMIARRCYGLSPNSRESPYVIVEDRSTNCGANAHETKEMLDAMTLYTPRSVLVVQDPTMSRRTAAAFQHEYSDLRELAPKVIAWPTFVPVVVAKPGQQGDDVAACLEFSGEGPTGERKDGLWDMRRYLDLLIGEIPRLRDDETGYGPRGKGFIAHVDIPEEVEEAWRVLSTAMNITDRPA